MKNDEYIKKLNEMRGIEMKMSLLYRRLAHVVSGPWREALAAEFETHADQEMKHAQLLMRRIKALGGVIGADVPPAPEVNGLSEILDSLVSLEKEGIDRWQKLYAALDEKDPFRHVIEEVLSVEVEHYDEALIWAQTEKASKVQEDISPELMQSPEPMEPEAQLPSSIVVGDQRRLLVSLKDPDVLDDDVVAAGTAWQDEDGGLHGDGIFIPMLFEPHAQTMYRNASVGVDVSPLSMLALRLQRNPFIKLDWENGDE